MQSTRKTPSRKQREGDEKLSATPDSTLQTNAHPDPEGQSPLTWSLERRLNEVLLAKGITEAEEILHEYLTVAFGVSFWRPGIVMKMFLENPATYVKDAFTCLSLASSELFIGFKELHEAVEAIGKTNRERMKHIRQLPCVLDFLRCHIGRAAEGRLGAALSAIRRGKERGVANEGTSSVCCADALAVAMKVAAISGAAATSEAVSAVADATAFMKTAVALKPWTREIKGAYDSVFNAAWGHVLTGDEYRDEPLGMKVVVGRPELWPRAAVDIAPELEDLNCHNLRSGALAVAVLTSKMGWPDAHFATPSCEGVCTACRSGGDGYHRDVCVSREVARAWYIVQEELDLLLESPGRYEPKPCFVTGTPGSGRSSGLGCFILHELLHYEPAGPQVIAYFVNGVAYFFYRRVGSSPGTVVLYRDQWAALQSIRRMRVNGVTVFTILNGAEGNISPSKFPDLWLGVVLIQPNEAHSSHGFKSFRSIYMNPDDENDLKALLAWKGLSMLPEDERNLPETKQRVEREWALVRERIAEIGPFARHVFNPKAFWRLRSEVHVIFRTVERLTRFSEEQLRHYFELTRGSAGSRLLGVMRVKGRPDGEGFRRVPLSAKIGRVLLRRFKVVLDNSFLHSDAAPESILVCSLLKSGMQRLTCGRMVPVLAKYLRRLPGGRCGVEVSEAGASVMQLLAMKNSRLPQSENLPAGNCGTRRCIKYMTLYLRADDNPAVFDGYFFVSEPKAFVALRMSTAPEHPTSVEELEQLNDALKANFVDWKVFKDSGAKWEMIYIQSALTDPVARCQPCNREETETSAAGEKMKRFWDTEVQQYAAVMETAYINALVDFIAALQPRL